MTRHRDISDLSKDELADLVDAIIEVLWPQGDLEEDWSGEAANEAADILTKAGLRPR